MLHNCWLDSEGDDNNDDGNNDDLFTETAFCGTSPIDSDDGGDTDTEVVYKVTSMTSSWRNRLKVRKPN